jgi:hypothetical protein
MKPVWLQYADKSVSFFNDGSWVYEPLRITFHLATPMLVKFPRPAFDSLVLALMVRRCYGVDMNKLPSNAILRGHELLPSNVSIPIKRHPSGLFYASFAEFPPEENIQEIARMLYYRRRFDINYVHYVSKKTKKVPMVKGTLKSCNIKHIYIHPRYVRFYCVGVRAILEPLMGDLQGLGSKTNTGNGAILDFEIKPIPECKHWVDNGLAMRPIPLRFLERFESAALAAWRPPYWAHDEVELCAEMGTPIVLKGMMIDA